MTSVPNVYLSDLKPKNYLKAINFEDESLTQYGAKDVEDLTWKQLLDGDTCTHCGRCTSVCPANITGKVLDPRWIIIATRERMIDKAPYKMAEGASGFMSWEDEISGKAEVHSQKSEVDSQNGAVTGTLLGTRPRLTKEAGETKN